MAAGEGGWSAYLQHGVGKLSNTVVRTAASLVGSVSGHSIERYIAAVLSQFLTIDIDIEQINGAFRGQFSNVRLTPAARQLLLDLSGPLKLELDLESSIIQELELQVDIEALLTGQTRSPQPGQLPQAFWPPQASLFRLEMGWFCMAAPGVLITIQGLQIELNALPGARLGWPGEDELAAAEASRCLDTVVQLAGWVDSVPQFAAEVIARQLVG